MAAPTHDAVVAYVARTRFPFPGQTTWPAGYVTLTNVPTPTRAIPAADGDHFPDIIIVDPSGRTREIGEVETTVDPAAIGRLRAASAATDTDTPTGVHHFFVYVPAGMEAQIQALLESHGISYAGVRGFLADAAGAITIVPFVTKGDPYDHQ